MLSRLNHSVLKNFTRAFSSANNPIEKYIETLRVINSDPNMYASRIAEQLSKYVEAVDIHFHDALVAGNISIKPLSSCRINAESALVSTTRIAPVLATHIGMPGKSQRPMPYSMLTPLGGISFLNLEHPDRSCTTLTPPAFAGLEMVWMDLFGMYRKNCGEYNLYIQKALATTSNEYAISRAAILNNATPEIIELYNKALNNIDLINGHINADKSNEWVR